MSRYTVPLGFTLVAIWVAFVCLMIGSNHASSTTTTPVHVVGQR